MHAIDLHPFSELFGGVARVQRCAGEEYALAAGSARYGARRARSCLLAPRVGDLVLFAGAPSGALYVLAVLEREDEQTEIDVAGDLSLRARGRCDVAGAEGVRLASTKTIELASEGLEIRAQRGDVFVDSLAYLGRRVRTEVEKLSTVASAVDRLFTSVRERVQRSYRTIEEMEQVRAGSLDIAAQDNVRMHARNTIVTAEAIAKINAQQIHLG